MDITNLTATNLRIYVEDHPEELDDIKRTVVDIAHKLETGTLTLMGMPLFFKEWRADHGQVIYSIFAEAYRKAGMDRDAQ
jgi:hypothetical protein